jgi:hypothetical protein
MALHNLKITVVDGGRQLGGGEFGSDLNRKKESGEKSSKDSLLYRFFNFNSTIKDSVKKAVSPTTFFAMQTGINLATQTGRQFINYYISDIGRRHGDSNYQFIVSRQIEKYSDIASIGLGAFSGAGAGSVAGPLGVGIGAVVGAASAGINIAFRDANRERNLQHELFKDHSSISYSLARTSYTGFTGRLR